MTTAFDEDQSPSPMNPRRMATDLEAIPEAEVDDMPHLRR
jgi:hypothetical protein